MQPPSNLVTPTMFKLIRLDIGCGTHPMRGWTGMDRIEREGVSVVHDFMNFPWPFTDESVMEARAEHVIEHIPHLCWHSRKFKDPFYSFFDEVWRILKTGTKFHIIAPHSDSRRAWSDPTHTRAINEQTLFYLSKEYREQRGVSHYDAKCNFDANYEIVLDSAGRPQDLKATFTRLD